MKRNLKEFLRYHVKAKDGPEGKIKDFLFDEDSWIVRYIDSDFGKWFRSNRILVPQVFIDEPKWEEKIFPIRLDKKTIEKGPHIEDHMPVSREYETQLVQHYQLEPYWPYTYAPPSAGSLFFPPRPLGIPPKTIDEKEVKSKLRSFQEVEGYNAIAKDKELGFIEDLIVDDHDWQIVYAVIDFTKLLPMSKKVLISIEGMKEISYVEHKVVLSLDPEKLKEAPHYDPDKILSKQDEKDLYDFFSWGMVT